MDYKYLILNVELINGLMLSHVIDKELYPNCRWEYREAHRWDGGFHPAELIIVYSCKEEENIHRYCYLLDKVAMVEVLVTNTDPGYQEYQLR